MKQLCDQGASSSSLSQATIHKTHQDFDQVFGDGEHKEAQLLPTQGRCLILLQSMDDSPPTEPGLCNGAYMQAHKENNPTNTQEPQTPNCLYLRPATTNYQGGHDLLDL